MKLRRSDVQIREVEILSFLLLIVRASNESSQAEKLPALVSRVTLIALTSKWALVPLVPWALLLPGIPFPPWPSLGPGREQ